MAGIVRLSRRFRETLGEDLADELEAGFDQLDALNSAAFREIFDVRLEHRLGEATAKLRQEMTELEARLSQEITEAKAELKRDIAELRVALAATESHLVRWMFLFWVGTIGISILLNL